MPRWYLQLELVPELHPRAQSLASQTAGAAVVCQGVFQETRVLALKNLQAIPVLGPTLDLQTS